MIFLESSARAWLIVHGVIGAALVAASTHLVFWTRGLLRGQAGRYRGARRFAAISLLLYVASFALGNLLYPAYKVKVRVEYFDEPAAVRADYEARAQAQALVESRRLNRTVPAARYDAPQLGKVTRTFDIKEHWAALGLAFAIGAFVMSWRWDPRRDLDSPGGDIAGKAIFWFALGAAACAWIGAVLGLYVTSFRAVGM